MLVRSRVTRSRHNSPCRTDRAIRKGRCAAAAIIGTGALDVDMKGIVFTEFLEMVESRYSADVVDEILEQSELESGGIYTSVGTYDHEEMIELLASLGQHTGLSPSELLCDFGEFLFGRFAALYPEFFQRATSALTFLSKVDDYIHVEIRKLYPDAELPEFDCESKRSGSLVMTYRSERPFASLAEGLIKGCIAHYGNAVDMQVVDLSDGEGTSARFLLNEP